MSKSNLLRQSLKVLADAMKGGDEQPDEDGSHDELCDCTRKLLATDAGRAKLLAALAPFDQYDAPDKVALRRLRANDQNEQPAVVNRNVFVTRQLAVHEHESDEDRGHEPDEDGDPDVEVDSRVLRPMAYFGKRSPGITTRQHANSSDDSPLRANALAMSARGYFGWRPNNKKKVQK